MKLNNMVKNAFIAITLLSSTLSALDKNILAYKDRGVKYYPKYVHKGYTKIGKASWYGNPFHGRLTASGERYNMYGMTAAHKTYALGTRLKVTNLKNRKSVVVRVNDRGPFHSTRKIDLSYGAAKKIGMIHKGVSRVKIEVLSSKKGLQKKRTYKRTVSKKSTHKKAIRKLAKNNNTRKKRKHLIVPQKSKKKHFTKKLNKKVKRVQIASFFSKKYANKFKKKHHLKNVTIVKHYLKSKKKMAYRVVINCNRDEAKKLLHSKKFSGALLLS
jgi:rare lipoprotein A